MMFSTRFLQMNNMMYYFLLFFKLTYSKLILEDIYSNRTVSVIAYNSLAWDIEDKIDGLFESKHNIKIPIVRLDQLSSTFDPCNEETFTIENVQPIVDHVYEMSSISYSNEENRWFGIVDLTVVSKQCNVQPLHLFYAPYLALYAQLVGADGIIWVHNGQPALAKSIAMPPEVDIIAQKVKGQVLNIPALVTKSTSDVDFSSVQFQWVVSDTISIEDNPYDSIHEPYGIYAIMWGIIGLFSFSMAIFILFHTKTVINYYYEKRYETSSYVALLMRLLILVPELLNSIMRVIVAIDPIGVLFRINYFNARMVTTMFLALSTFTDIVMIFYCNDVYQIFKSSRVLRPATPFVVKYKVGVYIIFLIALLMLVTDQLVTYLALVGKLGSANLILPMVYMILVNTFVTATLFNMSKKMKIEVSASVVTMKQTLQKASAEIPGSSKSSKSKVATPEVITSTATHHTEMIIKKSEALLKMRSFMIGAATSRIFTILSFVSVGAAIHKYSAVAYIATFILMGISSTVSSTSQILAALQLPHSNRRRHHISPSEPHKDNNGRGVGAMLINPPINSKITVNALNVEPTASKPS